MSRRLTLLLLLVCTIPSLGSQIAPQPPAPQDPPTQTMSAWQAVLLGIVEGLTEYLPVSSTGHLILTQRAMGIERGDEANAFAICIQLGAIAAVLALYRARLLQVMRGLAGRDHDGRALAKNIVIAFLPAALFGLLFEHWIESNLYGLWPIVCAWLTGGMAILAITYARKDRLPPSGKSLERLTLWAALAIGFMQCIAMWPGVSRSLVTILGGVLLGLSLPAAVEFSFLLGLLTLAAATAYKALQHGQGMMDAYGPANLALGFVAATLSAIVAVRWMVNYLNRHGLAIFGYYRIALGLAVGLWLLFRPA